MSRRPSGLSRRLGDGAPVPFTGSLHPKSRPSPFLSIGLVLLVTIYFYLYYISIIHRFSLV
ncbi:putative pectin methyltransferase CGR2/3 [Helianthus annuus]|nr:putative pectin methyltransferase CGR2/3 [Helianthus annuus]